MNLAVKLRRSLEADMQAELRDLERAVASGTREAGQGLKTELRRQVASAALGQRLPRGVLGRYREEAPTPAPDHRALIECADDLGRLGIDQARGVEAKVGTQLRFRGIGSTADGKVTVSYDADAKVIRLTVDESALEVPAENVQGLAEVATSGDSDDLTEGESHLLLAPAERAKLAGIEPGAEVNTVASAFGRTGAVVGQSGDYDAAQITETAARVFVTPAQRDRIDDALTPDAGGAEIHNYRFKPRDLDSSSTTYTVVAADAGRVIRTFAASAIAITYPGGLGDGFTCQVMKCAAGHPTIAPGSGVSMLKRPGDTITEPGGMASITTRGPDDIVIHGADTDSTA